MSDFTEKYYRQDENEMHIQNKDKSCQPQILYPIRLSSSDEGEIKDFQDKQKQKKLANTRPFFKKC